MLIFRVMHASQRHWLVVRLHACTNPGIYTSLPCRYDFSLDLSSSRPSYLECQQSQEPRSDRHQLNVPRRGCCVFICLHKLKLLISALPELDMFLIDPYSPLIQLRIGEPSATNNSCSNLSLVSTTEGLFVGCSHALDPHRQT